MVIFTQFCRLRCVAILLFGIVAGPLLTGCSSNNVSKDDEAKMKESFSQKGPLDINSVPPEQRERVRAFMKQNGPPPGASSAPAPH